MEQLQSGDIVKYSSPADEREAAVRFLVLEAHYNVDKPRVLLRLIQPRMPIAPTQTLLVSDVVFVPWAQV
jgi:hypothetical protein